jgi:hypothetical protein
MLRALLFVAAMLSVTVVANAATFGPISGTLAIRAGSKPPQTTPVVIGSVNLTDFDLPTAFASASLQTSITGGSHFKFSGAASSSTTVADPMGMPRATASTTFQQSFTTTAPQWLQLTAEVLSPPSDGQVSAAVSLGPTGQAATYTVNHSNGLEMTRNGLFPAGNYTVSGFAVTQASIPPAHAAAISGFVLIASLADFNGNAVVDGGDLATWRTGFGSTTGTFASGNLDGDGDADGADFMLWQRQLGTHALTVAAASAVPEPTGSLLIALGIGACVVRGFVYCRTCRSAARRAAASPAR